MKLIRKSKNCSKVLLPVFRLLLSRITYLEILGFLSLIEIYVKALPLNKCYLKR